MVDLPQLFRNPAESGAESADERSWWLRNRRERRHRLVHSRRLPTDRGFKQGERFIHLRVTKPERQMIIETQAVQLEHSVKGRLNGDSASAVSLPGSGDGPASCRDRLQVRRP